MRKTRCEEILSHEKMRTPEMRKLVNDFRDLWARLIELSNNDVPQVINPFIYLKFLIFIAGRIQKYI